MNAQIVVVSLVSAAVLLLSGMFGWRPLQQRRRPERFNNSRWKVKLIKETRRAFEQAQWKVKNGTVVSDQTIDLFVTSKIANFEVLCLDRTLQNFRSETAILEQLENTTRLIRLRNGCVMVVIDDHFPLDFARRAKLRGLLVVHVAELNSVARLARYADALPNEWSDLELSVLESSHSACLDLAQRLKEKNDTERAIEWARRAIRNRHGYSAHYLLFSLLLDSNDLAGAEQVGMEGLSYKPKDTIRFFQGFQKLCALRGDYTAVVSWAERWVAAEPDEPRAYDNLARIYQTQHNAPMAAVVISQALKLAPKDPDILRRAAKIFLLNGDLTAAILCAEDWITQGPKDGEGHEFLAGVWQRQKQYKKAASTIAVALAINPRSPSFMRRGSFVALDNGNFSEATRLAEQWLVLAPADPWAYDQLSRIYLLSAKYCEAEAATAKALAIDPTNTNFLRRAVEIQKRIKCLGC